MYKRQVFTVGHQIEVPLLQHKKLNKKQAHEEAARLIRQVGIAEDRLNDYPHQFSGGMRQRVGIAAALALSLIHICIVPVSYS